MHIVLIGGVPEILCRVPPMARVPLVRHPCTIHLQRSMSSPGYESRPNGTEVSATNLLYRMGDYTLEKANIKLHDLIPIPHSSHSAYFKDIAVCAVIQNDACLHSAALMVDFSEIGGQVSVSPYIFTVLSCLPRVTLRKRKITEGPSYASQKKI
ncbi:hypothetical protein TNCV_3419441 [Trichonephila clavipes]|nr:hypothetical protein TNCV_3419441 [Trichonephila clavipes]